MMNALKDIGKKLYRDPRSPYAESRELMKYYSEIPANWNNMLHIFELNFRNRSKIQTREQLDKVLNDIVIVFNSQIEPNVVNLIHHAHIILKSENTTTIKDLLAVYQQVAERQQKMMLGMPPQPAP